MLWNAKRTLGGVEACDKLGNRLEEVFFLIHGALPPRADLPLKLPLRAGAAPDMEGLMTETCPITGKTYFEDVFETADGATVYRVKAVGAIEMSVMTSTLCRSVSSTP